MQDKSPTQQFNQLLKTVLAMDTEAAFQYLSQADVDAEVVNRVAALLKTSEARTAFLENRGAADWLLEPIDDEDLSGRTLSNIKIIRLLGQGGMGAVYQGQDLTLQRTVAVKTLLNKQRINPAAAERFRREALLLSQLDHVNICRIYSLIETGQTDFLVLEFIQGEQLNAQHFKQLPKTKQLDLLTQMLKGLQAAHRKNIIHRDIKPDNIMLTKNGVLKILDFGISRLSESPMSPPAAATDHELSEKTTTGGPTQVGTLMGTLPYMSPEQAAGEELSTASDMYSLGLLLQTLLSEVPPYPKDTTAEELLELSHQGQTAIPTDLPGYWQKLIQSLKSYSPADRPTATMVLDQVHAIQAKPKKRLRWAAVALMAIMATLATGKYIKDLKYERTQAQLAQQKAEQVVAFLSGMFQQTTPYSSTGKDVTAVEVLNQAVKRIQTELSEQPDTRTYLSAIMADSLRQLGQVNEAKALLDEVMTTVDTDLEVTASTKSHVRETMADYWLETGQYEQAKDIYQTLLQSDQTNDPSNHIQINAKLVLALSNLGHCQQAVATAQTIAKQTVADTRLDLYRAHALNAMGMCHYFTGAYEDSIAYYQQTLDLIEQSQTDFGGLKLSVLDNMATSYSEVDQLDKTLEIMQQVVQSEEALLGANHIELVPGYDNMAATYYKMGDIEQALAWNQKALDVHDYNSNNKLVDEAEMMVSKAWTLSTRSVFYQYLKDYDQAEAISEEVLDLSLKSLPEMHLNVADAYYNLGKNQWFNNKVEQAEINSNKAMAIYQGIKQPLVRKHLSNHELQIVMFKDSEPEKAQSILLHLIELLEQEGERAEQIQLFKEKYQELLEL